MTNSQEFKLRTYRGDIPNFSIRNLLKAALKKAMDKSGLSVEQIAEKLSSILCSRFHPGTIYNWTSPSHCKHLPNPEALIVFCFITGSYEPLMALVSPLKDSIQLIGIDQAKLLKIINSKKTEMVEKSKQDDLWKELESISRKYNGIKSGVPFTEIEQ